MFEHMLEQNLAIYAVLHTDDRVVDMAVDLKEFPAANHSIDAFKNESVSRPNATSKCTALVARHLKRHK